MAAEEGRGRGWLGPASSSMSFLGSWKGTSFNTSAIPSPPLSSWLCWTLVASIAPGRSAFTGQWSTDTSSLPRSAGPDDCGDHGCPHELTHLHLQQQQHPVRHWRVAALPQECDRTGADGGGQVRRPILPGSSPCRQMSFPPAPCPRLPQGDVAGSRRCPGSQSTWVLGPPFSLTWVSSSPTLDHLSPSR